MDFKWKPAVAKTRGENVEMVHYGGLVAVQNGRVLLELGETGSERTYFRSAVKIWQSAPMMERARERFRFSDEEVALAVSSHNGELRHVNLAKQMLDKIGLSVDALKCGAHAPYGRTLPADEPLCALHNNCSGKHASMLAACVANGWPLENYIEFDHPLQVAIRKTIRAAAHLEPDSELKHGIDGCGVPTYFMTLKEMATMWSNVGAEFPEQRRCAAENSWCVAGEDEFDTILPIVTKGRIIAKRGGGALECLNVGSIGIVAKVADGDTKARDPMMMRALDILNLLSAEERTQLLPFATQKLFNVAGKQIGVIKPIF